MSQYDDIIQAAARQYNVDPALIRGMMATESSGNPGAVSNKGAVGLLQIMPSNYKALGITDPTDPTQNIMGGAKLISQLLDTSPDVATALRRYQGGDDTKAWGPVNAAYPGKVLAAAGVGAKPSSAAPATLPGIPTGAAGPASNLDDDTVFSAFARGAAPASTQPQPASAQVANPQSDDAIFAAMSKTPTSPAATSAAPAVGTASTAPVPQGSAPGPLTSAVIGFGKGVGDVASGIEQMAGHGLAGLGNMLGAKPVSAAGNWLTNDANAVVNQTNAESAAARAAHPIITGAGDLAGNMLMSAPLVMSAPASATLGGALATNAGLGALAGLAQPVDPNSQNYGLAKLQQAGFGAATGAVAPLIAPAARAAGAYVGDLSKALAAPYTEAGRQGIAAQIVKNAARGGPTLMDLGNIVPGSSPTLAEATANPGIATLQRTFRDVNPNPFVEREQQNAAARSAALGDVTGTAEDLAAARAARSADASDNYLATNVGIPTSNTGYNALKQYPAFQKAMKDATTMAQNAGVPSIETTVPRNQFMAGATGQLSPETYVSGRGLQWIKQSLDDQINSELRGGNNGMARNILGVKDQLLGLMDDNIDGYAAARAQYAQQSGPIDAMQYLQSRGYTDAQGNITLAKVQGALSDITKQQNKPGVNLAKSVTPDQISGITAIRDDLLRQANTGLGSSAGSNTAQNLATQQVVRAALPGKFGALASRLPAGTVGGALGTGLGYLLGGGEGAVIGGNAGALAGRGLGALANARNDEIQGYVTNMLLNPASAQGALNSAARAPLPFLPSSGLQRLLYPAVAGVGANRVGFGAPKLLSNSP